MLKSLDIGIAGAGPAGLAAALYLRAAGHRVVLHERFAEARPLGSGLILQPTGRAVLADLGLHDKIVALGQPLDRLRGTDAKSGRTVLDVRYDALKGLGRGLGVHRAALFAVLHDAVVAAGIEVRTGVTISGLSRGRGGGQVLVGGDGRSFGPFDLVIDALGATSPLKVFSKSPSQPRALGFGALWGTVPWVDAGFDQRALQQRYQRAAVMIGVLPIGRQRVGGPALAALFWSLKVDDYKALTARGIAAWKERLRGLWPEVAPHLDAIAGFEELSLARYAHHTLKVPAGEGIAFIGDSAHATSPQLGQGANMALLDALALNMALSRAGSVAEALENYVRLRRWYVRLYQALSYAFTPFYQSDSVALPMIRDFMVSYAARIPPAPQFLAAMVAGSLMSPVRRLGLEAAPVLEDQRGMSGQT